VFLSRFPNVAQELLCNSSLLSQVLIEGGRAVPADDEEDEAQNETPDSVDVDCEEDGNNTDDGSEEPQSTISAAGSVSASKAGNADKKAFTSVGLKIG